MIDEAVRFVWEQVRLFLWGDTGRGFDVGKPKSFETLFDFVRTQGQESLASFAEDEFRLVVAICLLGPDTVGPPPAAIRDHLSEITRRFEPSETKRLDRVMEFAIAFGCGWQRQIRPDGGAWEQRWADAVRGLSRALEPAVTQARLWLTQHVAHYPRAKDNDLSDAHVLTMRLLHPLHLEQEDALSITYRDSDALVAPTCRGPTSVPSGAKYVWTIIEKTRLVGPHKTFSIDAGTTIILTVHDTEARITVNYAGQRLQLQEGQTANMAESAALAIWACTCGNRQCAQRHRLGRWNARIGSLWSFVASAVKMLPQLQTNAFVQGMYFSLLADAGEGGARLRLVNVEYKVCRICAVEYEGDQCPDCVTPPDVHTRRRTYPRLVCVGTDPPTYEREERLHCTNRECRNVYTLPDGWEGWEQIRQAKAWQKYPGRLPDSMRGHNIDVRRLQQTIATRLATLDCPLCEAHASRRATIVWVRQFLHRVEQDPYDLRSE
jgi:hypothetical protein